MLLSDIKLNPSNPRVIKDNKFKQLVNSIKQFPEMLELRPVVVNADNVVLGGNMRLRACQAAGLKEIPVVVADELTSEQQAEFIIKDNVGFGEWNWELLANEWNVEQLAEWGVDVPKFETTIEDEDELDIEGISEIQTTIEHGDLIEIGEHRLLCGDCLNTTHVDKLMNSEKPEFIFTDPPYGMNAVSKSGVLKKKYKTDILGDNDNNTAKEAFVYFYNLYNDATQVWWGANYYSSCLPDAECWLVWDKNNGGSDQTDCELAWCNARSVVRQFTQASEKANRIHPTQKPVELVVWAINKFANEAKIVSDFFSGSGSTLVAAHKLNKTFYGMELDPKFCQAIIDRMRKHEPTIVVKVNGKVFQ